MSRTERRKSEQSNDDVRTRRKRRLTKEMIESDGSWKIKLLPIQFDDYPSKKCLGLPRDEGTSSWVLPSETWEVAALLESFRNLEERL